MRLCLVISRSVATFAAAIACAPAPVHAAPATVTAEQRIGDRTRTLTVATAAFAAPTKVDVILPVGYDAQPRRRWPVTYVTAGTMNHYDSFRKLVRGVELTTRYPSIIVSPDGNSGYWSDWYNGGAFGPPRYETFVIDELVPLIDARLRTIPSRGARAIFGISMGGYGAVMLAARHPDLFVAAASLSGAADSNDALLGAALSFSSTFDGAPADAIYGPRATQEIRWRAHNPVDLAENLRDVDLQVRAANGTLAPQIGEDPLSADLLSCPVEGGTYRGSVNLHERLLAIGKPHVWRDYGAGCHSRPNFEREIRDTLVVFERILADPPAAPTAVDYRSAEPRFRVWGWDVRADAARAPEFLRLRGDARAMTFTGSGRTAVVSPPAYRGLRRVDVDGVPAAVDRDGRLRFDVDLGPAHAVQQYTRGAPTVFTTRRIAFAPHAVLRITGARRMGRGIRVCVRALGGGVPRATVTAGGTTRRWSIGAARRCRRIASGTATRVTVRGRDRFGHPVRAASAVRR